MPTLDLGSVVGPQGIQGVTGPQGPQGIQGPAGQGVPAGGTAGQALVKLSGTNYDTGWSSVDYYQAGDTISLDGALLTGFVNQSNAAFFTLLLPKILPSSTYITITHNLTIDYIRGNATLSTGTVTAISRTNQNVITIGVSISGTAITTYHAAAALFHGSITFNAAS